MSDVTSKRIIPFSPPDVGENEINEIIETIRSGWITTGPRTKLFERRLAAYMETGDNHISCETPEAGAKYGNRVVCLNSATAAEELCLRLLGIQPGDEVIVPAYTYTATASAAVHCGAKVIFIDSKKDGSSETHMPEMDYDALEMAITEKTKAIIIADLYGIVSDYDKVYEIVRRKKALFRPVESDGSPLSELSSKIQKGLGEITVFADCAHSLGASRIVRSTGKGLLNHPERKYCGQIANFSSFSFHAVKNITTAEGGAATWCLPESVYNQGVTDEAIYHMFQLLSLHGQSKDALAKTTAGGWEYDIIGPWYKCNMTDIMAAIGLRQLDRYNDLITRRAEIIRLYDAVADELSLFHLNHHTPTMDSSNHLYIVRIPGIDEVKRNEIIKTLAEYGVATNVHYKPLPMMTAYGADAFCCPNAYDYYHNLITLPLHTRLSDEDADYVCKCLKEVIEA